MILSSTDVPKDYNNLLHCLNIDELVFFRLPDFKLISLDNMSSICIDMKYTLSGPGQKVLPCDWEQCVFCSSKNVLHAIEEINYKTTQMGWTENVIIIGTKGKMRSQ